MGVFVIYYEGNDRTIVECVHCGCWWRVCLFRALWTCVSFFSTDRYIGACIVFFAIGGVGAGIGLLSSGLLQAVSGGTAFMPVAHAATRVGESNRDGV